MMRNSTLNQVRAEILTWVFQTGTILGCAAFFILSSPGQVSAANILANPGFEAGSLTNWTTFGANNYIQSNTGVAHSGVNCCKVYGQFIASTNYTGIYQDRPSAPGAIYSTDGWVCSLSSDNIKGQDAIWIEVSFRNASGNALALYRSAVVTSDNIASFGGLNTWFDLQVTNQCSFVNPMKLILLPGTVTNTVTSLVAPAGTAYVRHQIVFMQGSDNADGSVYFDDLTLNQTGGTIITPPAPTQLNLVWSDEFNEADGSSPDPANWGFDVGGGGFGNNQQEYDTSRTNNARIEGGHLVIEAAQETYTGADNVTRNYTSARMLTKGKWSWTYGRIEARIKIPRGQGIWPAFWTLGKGIDSVGWPKCGEIDIMENIGKTSDQGTEHGTIHGPISNGTDYNGNSGVGGTYTLLGGALADDFHIYAVEWTTNQIKWYLDNHQFFTATPASLPGGGIWVFTNSQFVILNVAVGGNWPGYPDGTTTFPQQMLVDYLRVYQQTAPLQISAMTQSNGNVVLAWPTNIACHLQAQTNSLVDGNWSGCQ